MFSPFSFFFILQRPDLPILLLFAHFVFPFFKFLFTFDLFVLNDELIKLILYLLKIYPILFLDCDLLSVSSVHTLAIFFSPLFTIHLI